MGWVKIEGKINESTMYRNIETLNFRIGYGDRRLLTTKTTILLLQKLGHLLRIVVGLTQTFGKISPLVFSVVAFTAQLN